MKKPFSLFIVFMFTLIGSLRGDWLYFNYYPWVYDSVSNDWLYLRSNGGKIYAYFKDTKEWKVFGETKTTWEDEYAKWIKNPDPYGGLEVLQLIKRAKDDQVSSLDIGDLGVLDIQPLEGLYRLTALGIGDSEITDISPLANLTDLTLLILKDNKNLKNLSSLSKLTKLKELDLRYNDLNEIDLSPLYLLPALEKLRVSSGLITEFQINEIQRNLPNCKVTFDEDGHDIAWDLEPHWDN